MNMISISEMNMISISEMNMISICGGWGYYSNVAKSRPGSADGSHE